MSDFEYKLFRRNITSRNIVNYLPATDETVDESPTARNADGLTEEFHEYLKAHEYQLRHRAETLGPEDATELRRLLPATFAPEQAATAVTVGHKIALKTASMFIRKHGENILANNIEAAFPEAFDESVTADEVERWERTEEHRYAKEGEWFEAIATGRPMLATCDRNDDPRWILRKVVSDEADDSEIDDGMVLDVAAGTGADIIRARSSYVK